MTILWGRSSVDSGGEWSQFLLLRFDLRIKIKSDGSTIIRSGFSSLKVASKVCSVIVLNFCSDLSHFLFKNEVERSEIENLRGSAADVCLSLPGEKVNISLGKNFYKSFSNFSKLPLRPVKLVKPSKPSKPLKPLEDLKKQNSEVDTPLHLSVIVVGVSVVSSVNHGGLNIFVVVDLISRALKLRNNCKNHLVELALDTRSNTESWSLSFSSKTPFIRVYKTFVRCKEKRLTRILDGSRLLWLNLDKKTFL